MSTLTQAPTGNTIKAQAQAIAKAPKVKPLKATETAPAWYAEYNNRLTKGLNIEGLKVTYLNGNPLTADEALMGAAIGGKKGTPKRTTNGGVEALWLAMTLRQGGGHKGDYVALKGHGFAMNCLTYAQAPAAIKRGQYGWVVVTVAADGAYISRLTPKGAEYARELGIKAAVVERMSRPYVAPGTPKAPKGDKGDKAQPKAAKARNGAGKAAGKGDKPVATTPPATPPKPASEAPKPVEAATAGPKVVEANLPDAVVKANVGFASPRD